MRPDARLSRITTRIPPINVSSYLTLEGVCTYEAEP